MIANVLLPQKAPIVIIGGGIIDISTLYHLAHRNVPSVLLERKKIASSSPITNQIGKTGIQRLD